MRSRDRLLFVVHACLASMLVGLFATLSSGCISQLRSSESLKRVLFRNMNNITYEWAWQILSIAIITIIAYLISRKKDNPLEVTYKSLWWSVVASLLYNLAIILI